MFSSMTRLLGIGACATALALGVTAPANASWYPAHAGGTGATIRDCYHPATVWPPSLGCNPVTVAP